MSYIITHTNKKFHYDIPDVSSICIEDIAQGLSNTCRYSGQIPEFYSVAQHSVIVSYAVPRRLALTGLLHDAAEAYVCDLPTPLKRKLPEYVEIEESIIWCINKKFGLSQVKDPELKKWDRIVLNTEMRDLKGIDFGTEGTIPDIIHPCDPKMARHLFLKRFEELTDWRSNHV